MAPIPSYRVDMIPLFIIHIVPPAIIHPMALSLLKVFPVRAPHTPSCQSEQTRSRRLGSSSHSH